MSERGLRGVAAFGDDAALLGLVEYDPASLDAISGEAVEAEPLEQLGSKPEAGEAGTSVGARIRASRTAVGMTGDALGAAVGLTKDKISKIESGRRRVGASEVVVIARALGVSIQTLMGVDMPQQSQSLALAARLAPAASSLTQTGSGSGQLEAGMADHARKLLEYDDILTRLAQMPAATPSSLGRSLTDAASDRGRFPRTPRSNSAAIAQGRDLAQLCRQTLNLGIDGIGDLPALIEMHFAVDVALAPLGTVCDGMCAHTENAALLLATSDFPEGHVRFTLAHELGHHLLGDPRPVIAEAKEQMFDPSDTVERRVNAFAGYFLMPDQGLRHTLTWAGRQPGSTISSRHLAALLERFNVSRQALMYQLRRSGELPWDRRADLDGASVGELLAVNSDLAPSGRSNTTHGNLRSPQRLIGAARTAAQNETVGLGVLAALLGREDDDSLWDEVMDDGGMPRTL